jgi:ERCC4-type nuclease
LGLPKKAIQGALVSLTVVFGIPVLRARDPIESAQLILYAGCQMNRVPRPVARRRFVRPKLKRNVQLGILQALPRLGLDRAERVLSKFETIGALAYASPYDIEQVDGIGPRTAQAIYWALH